MQNQAYVQTIFCPIESQNQGKSQPQMSVPLPAEMPKTDGQLDEQKQSPKQKEDQNIYYFNMFFSPKDTAESLKRRNDNLEMLNFQNSDEEPDDVFNRRKKKVVDLIHKEQEQLQAILQIKAENEAKYLAIIEFIKLFCQLKEKVIGIRTDYYSNKTFCALKNSTEDQLCQLTKVVHNMYNNIMKESKFTDTNSQSTSEQSHNNDERILEFLIIPRFLISKEKISRLCRDEILQRNFQFLVSCECLGHYNNEANKKMPEENQMVYVRQLLQKRDGRERFKKICSINHGNKFLKNYGSTYYDLYSKSLEYLRQLDNLIKRGKKYETIKKQLEKLPYESDPISSIYSQSQSESSNSIYNFKNIDECLKKMQKSENSDHLQSQMRDQLGQISSSKVESSQMRKKGPKRLMSMPLHEEDQEKKPKSFGVRKSQTMQTKTTENIILIPPPHSFDC